MSYWNCVSKDDLKDFVITEVIFSSSHDRKSLVAVWDVLEYDSFFVVESYQNRGHKQKFSDIDLAIDAYNKL